MTRYLSATVLGLMAVMFFSSGMMDNNGQAGRTGSPGELTCRDGCHNSFALNSGGGSITLGSTNMLNWEYVPGTTYHMTVTVAKAGVNLFGVGLEALTSTNDNAGMLNITDAASTQIKFAAVSGVSRRNVVHKLNGGVGTDGKTFQFDWVAPSSDIGNVTFYFAGNAANGQNNMAGDHIYTGSQVITPAIGTGLEEVDRTSGVQVWPNPVVDHLSIAYHQDGTGRVLAELYGADGRLLAQPLNADRAPGRHVESLGDLSQWPAGVYHLRIQIDGQDHLHRVVRLDR